MVGNEKEKEKMRSLLIILALTTLLIPTLGAKERESGNKRFNYGVSLSANAPFVTERKMFVNWNEKEKPTNETKLAGSIALFARVNMKRHYLQFEAGNSIMRDNTIYDIKSFGYATNKNVESKNFAITLDVPILYGYNFVKRNNYELSLFGGPKMRYTYYNKENIENPDGIYFNVKEDIHPVTACCIIGMGAKISKFILDFRYEFGITVHNKPGTYTLHENNILISEGTLYAKRSINLLSFSLGVIL